MKTNKKVSKKIGKANKSTSNGNGNKAKTEQVWETRKQAEEVKKEVVVVETAPLVAPASTIQPILDFLKELTEEVANLKKQVAESKKETPTKPIKKAKVEVVESSTPIQVPATLNRDTAVELLIKLREAKKVRPADIAKFVGIKSSSVACWLNGVSSPSRKHMPKVAELIGQFAS